MLYRSWSSCRSRSLLSQLGHYVGSGSKGFLPGREAGQLWMYVQALIEIALQSDHSLSGCNTDVMKAFESVPRQPLQAVGHLLGLPPALLRAWFAFLDGCVRRFTLHGTVGAGLTSSSGLPEGCGLSVLGMTLIDWIYEVYYSRYAPNCRSFSFVDNYDLVSSAMSDLFQGASTLKSYMSIWHLALDDSKTFFWSVLARDRDLLRSSGLSVRLQASDLGGAMTYCRRTSAGAQLTRLRALQPHWLALRRSPMLLGQKQQLIYVALWPRALHAIGISLLSPTHLQTLRTQACKALGWTSAGSQPIVRLSLLSIAPELDPGYYQLQRVFTDFQRFLRKDSALLELWCAYMQNYDGTWFSGPFSKILEQCALIGWQIHSPPWFQDHDQIRWNLIDIPKSLLKQLLLDGWHQHIGQLLARRKDFAGQQGLHWRLSKEEKSLTALQTAQLHALRDGSFMTQDYLGRFDLQRGFQCQFCPAMDSMQH